MGPTPTPLSTMPLPPANGYEYDRLRGGYSLHWDSLDAFEAWKRVEEVESCVEFIVQETRRPRGNNPENAAFSWRRIYRCARRGTGGKGKPYQKKFPDRERKVGSKRVSTSASVLDVEIDTISSWKKDAKRVL